MRIPLAVLVLAYSLSIGGLVLIPGIDSDGEPWRFDFFHAFYFISITGPTIGFGELPHEFTGAQRMWTIVCIYCTVLSWLYAVGEIFRLMQDQTFQRAVSEQRFRYQISHMRQPYYLICGYGEAGSLLVRALTRRGISCVVLDIDNNRINELVLDDLSLNVPALSCDASEVYNLENAGIKNSKCLGVVAITDNDRVNVKIAVSAKLLRPRLRVIARGQTTEACANMASFKTDSIINPFSSFAERLGLAIRSPSINLLHAWLGSLPGHALQKPQEPPHGHWIICGYGRFGRAVHAYLLNEGIDVTVIDSDAANAPDGAIIGSGVELEPLLQAGAETAVGLVAGTNDDANNLSVIMTARDINPNLYLVGRQDHRSNSPLFAAANLDLTIQTSRIIVWQILAQIIVPMLHEFLTLARKQDEAWAKELLTSIKACCNNKTPETYAIRLDEQQAPAVNQALEAGANIKIEDLMRDPLDYDQTMPCIALMLIRYGEPHLLPALDRSLEPGDKLLFCSALGTKKRMQWILHTPNALEYVLTGTSVPDGAIWRWLQRRRIVQPHEEQGV